MAGRLGAPRTGASPRCTRPAIRGRAAAMSISSTPARPCRRPCARRSAGPAAIRRLSNLTVTDLVCTDGEVVGAVALASRERASRDDRRQGGDHRDRRADAHLSAQQRLGQYGRRRLCAGAARRRRAHRHGVRAVLSDRPSGAAAGRHGPDHVGPVPLQARRPAAQRRRQRIPAALRQRRAAVIRHRATSPPTRSPRRSRPGAARRMAASISRFAHVPEAALRGGVRAGHRPAGEQRHRSDARCRSRSRRSRTITWAASRWTSAWRAECPGCSRPARRRAAPMAPTGCPATRSPRRWCLVRRPD